MNLIYRTREKKIKKVPVKIQIGHEKEKYEKKCTWKQPIKNSDKLYKRFLRSLFGFTENKKDFLGMLEKNYARFLSSQDNFQIAAHPATHCH